MDAQQQLFLRIITAGKKRPTDRPTDGWWIHHSSYFCRVPHRKLLALGAYDSFNQFLLLLSVQNSIIWNSFQVNVTCLIKIKIYSNINFITLEFITETLDFTMIGFTEPLRIIALVLLEWRDKNLDSSYRVWHGVLPIFGLLLIS